MSWTARFTAVFLLFAACALVPLWGKDKKSPPAYALVTGTVFKDSGLSLAGAEVQMAPQNQGKKGKTLKTQTDARGEFAFRLPAGAGQFTLTARAPGYADQSKPVTVSGEDRVEVFFQLEPASK